MSEGQWIGKIFWRVSLGLCFALAAGILIIRTPLTSAALVAIGAAVAAITFWKWPVGLCIGLAEVFAFSHGHLIDAQWFGHIFSSRMIVFAGFMLGWTMQDRGRSWRSWKSSALFLPIITLMATIAVGFVHGFLRYGFSRAFEDANAYLFLLYAFPILSIDWTPKYRRWLLQTIAASSAFVSTLSLALLYIFTHLPEPIMRASYRFIRDARIGEMTRMPDGIYRIFLQSQWIVLVLFFLLTAYVFALKTRRWIVGTGMALCLSVLLLSFSRSFAIGLMAGLMILFLFNLHHRLPFREWMKWVRFDIMVAVGAIIIVAAVIWFPLPPPRARAEAIATIWSDRAGLSDVAISSRWNLLTPAWKGIASSWIFGSGFGTTVRYQSDDPYVLDKHPGGIIETSAIEWGWLEIWLKTGLPGLFAFFWLFFSMIRLLLLEAVDDNRWIRVGITSIIVALAAVHVFSPYLNHPLGIATLLLAIPFCQNKKTAVEAIMIPRQERQPSLAPLMPMPYPRTNASTPIESRPSS